MILLNDDLYELMMENIENKGIREHVFEEKISITYEDKIALCSALETDINYWEKCIRLHPNEKDELIRHMRKYISHDERLMNIFHL